MTVVEAKRGSVLKLVHLTAGLAFLIIFLGTGQYMDIKYDHLQGFDDATRMLFRSNHIYVLISAFLNVMLGLYVTVQRNRWRLVLQVAGSALILGATILFLIGFFTEPFYSDLYRPYTRLGVKALAFGGLSHMAAVLLPGSQSHGE